MDKLTHINEKGDAHMVDISAKKFTHRTAIAESIVSMKMKTLKAISQQTIAKGDVMACARIAGIMAAKQTSHLIPMCHPIRISSVEINITVVESKSHLKIETICQSYDQTGIEMESLVAASIAALTVYDMCKSYDKGIVISETKLMVKKGGKSGTWVLT